MTRAVLTPRAVWWGARAPVGLSKLCQLLALSAWHGIAQERSAGSSGKQISALRIEISDQSFSLAFFFFFWIYFLLTPPWASAW